MARKATKAAKSKPVPKTETRDVDVLLAESIDNIREDRSRTNVLLVDLMQHLSGAPERNERLGIIAAKYLEVLQRSNEQLVKLAELARKRAGTSEDPYAELTNEDREKLLDEINEGN